jgi:AcrR family transcriptional regulator
MPEGRIEQTPKTKTRPGGRTERNRQAVADAVLACVREGRLDFEIQEIAAISGVHRTTISRRWPDRGALMAEAMREHGGHFSVSFTGDWETDVRQISQRIFDFFGEPAELAMNRMLAISENVTFHRAMLEYWTPVYNTLQEPIRRAKGDGLIKPDVDEDLVMIMMSSVAILYTVLRMPIDRDLPVRLADQIISLCRSNPATATKRNANARRSPDNQVEQIQQPLAKRV